MSKTKIYILIIAILFSVLTNLAVAQTIFTDVIVDIFNYDLYKTSQGVDVINLQKVLNLDGDTVVSCNGTGSVDKETDYFGPITETAVIKFQNKYGISPANGYVGQKTRDILNKIYRCYFITGYCTETYSMKTVDSICNASNIPSQSQEVLDTCKLLEELIIGDVVKTDKIELARRAASQYDSSGACNIVFVDLKVNGSDSASITDGSPATLSWNSSGVTSCLLSSQTQGPSGSKVVYPFQSSKLSIVCDSPYGEVSDSVQINVSGKLGDDSLDDLIDYPKIPEVSYGRCLIQKKISDNLDKPVMWTASSSIANEVLKIVSTIWTTRNSSETTTGTTTLFTSKGTVVTRAKINAITTSNNELSIFCSLDPNNDSGEEEATTTKRGGDDGSCNLLLVAWHTIVGGRCAPHWR